MSTALLLGAAAALAWSVSTLTLAKAGRVAGTWTTVFWTSLVGSLAASLAATTSGPPGGDLTEWSAVGLAGFAFAASVILYLMAVRGGQISLVNPIVGCEGGFAALIAVVAGEALGLPTSVGLIGMVVAVVLVTGSAASSSSGAEALPEDRSTLRTVALALAVAFSFAFVFYFSGKAADIDPMWVVAGARLVPTTIAFALCVRKGTLIPPPSTRLLLLLSGLIDALGFVCYVAAAQDSLAVAAVAASQYATLATLGAVVLFSERLQARQWVGVGLLGTAAAVVAAAG